MLSFETRSVFYGQQKRFYCQVNDPAAGREMVCTLPSKDRNKSIREGMKLALALKVPTEGAVRQAPAETAARQVTADFNS